MMTFCLSVHSKLYSIVIDGFINHVLQDAWPSVNEALLANGVIDSCLVCIFLYQSINSVTNQFHIQSV